MLFLIETIFSFVLLHATVDAQLLKRPNFNKHIIYPGRDFVFHYAMGDNATFSYALCDRQIGKFKRKCFLTLETVRYDGTSFKKTCLTRLTAKKKFKVVNNKYALAPFGKNHLVFIWNEGEKRDNIEETCSTYKEFLKVRVIDMKTCKFHETNITADGRDEINEDKSKINSLNIITYDYDIVELFFRNEQICGKSLRCSLYYDSEEEEFSETPVPTLAAAYNASADIQPLMSPDSFVIGYVVRTDYFEDGHVNLLSPNGQILLSHSYSWSIFNIPRRISSLALTREQGRLGICQQEMLVPRLDCSVFDHEGNGTLGFSLVIRSASVARLRMRNLEDGGILLLIGYAARPSETEKDRGAVAAGFEELDVVRIGEDGEIQEYHGTRKFECPLSGSVVDVDFFRRTGYRYCFYIACTWPKSWNVSEDEFHLKLFSECYT